MHAYNIRDTVVNMHAYALSIGAGIKSVAPGDVEDTVVKMQSYVSVAPPFCNIIAFFWIMTISVYIHLMYTCMHII